jgi:hypothetical protein
LSQLQTLLARGLARTADEWPRLRQAYGWIQRAAQLLGNEAQQDLFALRRAYRELLGEMSRQRTDLGPLAPGVAHFLKVTRSYWTGLFACYQVPDLPPTNNDLEQLFGAVRYQERRASGRKTASPGLVVRGRVRVVAAIATRQSAFSAAQLRPVRLDDWRRLRQELDQRHETRRAQARFRRDPVAYLAHAEALLLQQGLPP